jgi:hypothetical protein
MIFENMTKKKFCPTKIQKKIENSKKTEVFPNFCFSKVFPMAKIVSFRPNHKIFNGFMGGSGKKKKVYRNS